MTPGLAQALGEALVAHGEPKQAQRVFSEIVEFDPDDPMSRQLLGDIFLRHQWYEGAYRQYEDLRALEPEDALASIRLARAAAGAGRTDEALRVLRQVAAGEGRPGAEDPRRFARLHAAAYLARLHAAKTDEVPVAALERELKRTQLFEGPTIWTLLVWEDLDASLVIAADATRDARVTADAMRAADTGLVALESPVGKSAELTVRRADLSTRTIAYHRITIGFDGKAFDIGVEPGMVSTKQPEPEPVLEGEQG
jgi:tetratricopeptide (TPR) repeat protein